MAVKGKNKRKNSPRGFYSRALDDLHFEAANIIARLVKTRYQITKEQKKSLKEAIQKVLTEVAVPLGVGVGEKILSTKF